MPERRSYAVQLCTIQDLTLFLVMRIAAMIRCHTPFFPQREKRVYVACQFPNAESESRHGLPVRAIHSTASINRRLSFAVTPQSVVLPGSKYLIRSHWSSLSGVRDIVSGSS